MAMKLRVGDLYAECPYCGSTDFVARDDESRELVCAQCDGYSSRQLLLERIGDTAAQQARASLIRLKNERRKKQRPG
jgi:transcription initiation factor TFIIIB Brf1 subunit/transcription initiation factor TFIIB